MRIFESNEWKRTMVFDDDDDNDDENDNNNNVKRACVYACFYAFVFDGIVITLFDAL